MSLLLRAFQANGVGYDEGTQWLGLDRRQPIGDADVAGIAWALHLDADDLRRRFVVLECRGGGRWVHLAGQRLSRWIAPTCMTAKVCPDCLREKGFAKMAWLARALPACASHGYSFIQKCMACGKSVRWARPGVRLCKCGRFYKSAAAHEPAPAELEHWLHWVEAVIEGNYFAAESALRKLPLLLGEMSLDGAFRLVEAFGLLETSADSVRNVRHNAASPDVVGAVLVRGLERISRVVQPEDVCELPFDVVHLPALNDLVDMAACHTDGQRAAWLLDVHRSLRSAGVPRVGARPRRQIPLFL